jgi:hypothetical protein
VRFGLPVAVSVRNLKRPVGLGDTIIIAVGRGRDMLNDAVELLNSEPKRYKIVSPSAKRSALTVKFRAM